MGLNMRTQAESLFLQIGYGRENAIVRPENKTLDRHLRDLVTQANENGEVIINVGEGYYRPRPWIIAEKMEFNEYIAKDDSRAKRILRKKKKMQSAFEQIGGAHEFQEQGETWGTGSGEDFIQLRLQL